MFKLITIFITFFILPASPANIRIIGGHDADIAQHPWQVSLFYNTETFCGGSLIAPIYVLTAAHCVEDQRQFHVRAGTNSSLTGGEIVGVAEIILYPNRSYQHDIAIIRLEREISGTYIKPIALPSFGTPIPDGAYINVAGWGKMDQIEPIYPEMLQEVDIPIVNHEECAEIYINMFSYMTITKNMFCAGIMGRGGKAPCYGDSGGPAVYDGQLVGIISWGFKCADGEFPAVFTQVSNYINWIDKYVLPSAA